MRKIFMAMVMFPFLHRNYAAAAGNYETYYFERRRRFHSFTGIMRLQLVSIVDTNTQGVAVSIPSQELCGCSCF